MWQKRVAILTSADWLWVKTVGCAVLCSTTCFGVDDCDDDAAVFWLLFCCELFALLPWLDDVQLLTGGCCFFFSAS